MPSTHESVRRKKRLYHTYNEKLIPPLVYLLLIPESIPTFALPRVIVMALYITWKTAKKNIKMCN